MAENSNHPVLRTVWSLTPRQDAGLLPAKPGSGNCLAFYFGRIA
jgi:hypothetical protein